MERVRASKRCNQISRLEAEAAENERFEKEGPRLTFEQAHRQASERVLQRMDAGDPEPTDEEFAALRDKAWERYWAKRGR